jgi:hypothetical protein
MNVRMGSFAMPTVSHSSETIASPADFKRHHYHISAMVASKLLRILV